MNAAIKFAIRVSVLVIIGGFLSATLARMSPGFGVGDEELDSRLSAASVQSFRNARAQNADWGTFYFRYWSRILHGDLGTSISLQRPVRSLVVERFPETLISVRVGLALGWSLGLGLAIASVISKSALVDAGASLVAGFVLCVPVAALALFCVMARTPGRIVIGIVVFPKVFRFARNLFLRNLHLPHVLMARAKGVRPWRVFVWHISPVAVPQLLALAGITVSTAFTAAIPVESLCDLPGIGQLAWKAALSRDLELLVLLAMIVSFITLIANCCAELLGGTRQAGQA